MPSMARATRSARPTPDAGAPTTAPGVATADSWIAAPLLGAGPLQRLASRPETLHGPAGDAAPTDAPLAASAGEQGLTVGRADDPAERAADAVADRAMAALRRSSEAPMGGPGTGTRTGAVDRSVAGSSIRDALRRSSSATTGAEVGRDGGTISDRLSGEIRARLGSGSPMPDPLRRSMEDALGGSLPGVRLHTDDTAARLSRQVSARAFTVGKDIFFGAGEYQPQTEDGQHTLAHELAHATGASAAVQRTVVRRTISKSGRDVRALRSVSGRIKGLVKGDTLDMLATMVDGYRREKDTTRQAAALRIIITLCDRYRMENEGAQGASKGARLALVEDIKAEAMRDQGQLLAQQRYLKDAYGVGSTTPLTKQKDISQTHLGAKAVASGTPNGIVEGAGAKTIELAREYGLTEAEVLALRTYTANDYTYINPATANDRTWMAQQNPLAMDPSVLDGSPAAKRRPEMATLMEEGSLHTGVAMAGLNKLPVMQGDVWRGARMSQEELDGRYGGTTFTFKTITSSACDRKPAQTFADGFSPTPPRPDQTIAVMVKLYVNNARDMRLFSIYGAGEEEWVVLPGATFNIVSVEDEKDPKFRKPGIKVAPATAWKVVTMKQTK